jgi:hypothetical protein
MKNESSNGKILNVTTTVAIIVMASAMFRLLPHLPNFVPLTAMALFSGKMLSDKRLAVAIVLASMIVSDAIIGFDVTTPFVYLALVISVLVGASGFKNLSSSALTIGSGSVLFFLITNFSVWLLQDIYPKSLDGLALCYTMALPFFRNSLIADCFYSLVFFGIMYALENRHQLRAANID